MKEDNETLASEMLHNLDAQNKRQQVTIVALILVIIVMIIFFFSYENQFDTTGETYLEQSQKDVNNSSMIGEIN